MTDAEPAGDRDPSQREIPQGKTRRQRVPEPKLDIAVLGVFGPRRLRIGVLKNRGGEGVVNVLERDLIEGRYRVLEIDAASIHLRDTAATGAAPIRLEIP